MVHYPALTRLVPLTTIRRERVLPIAGDVLVNRGARVEPVSVIARAERHGPYRILEVAQGLRVSSEAAEKYIRAHRDQPVKAGQAVATRRSALGLFPRVVRAPEDGVVIAVGGGRVLLQTYGSSIEVRAYLPGTVESVIPQRGVIVETTGALIQAVWGTGGESFGVLKLLVDQPDKPLQARSIDVASHGAVLVGGSTLDREALQQSLELQVRGIIIGSLDPALLELAETVPFPIVVTEGLGKAPMAAPIFRLLQTNEGREAAISGRTGSRWDGVRPEIVIPLAARTAPPAPPPDTPLSVGLQVRVMRGLAAGRLGTIRLLPGQPMAPETDVRAWGAVVKFEDGEEQLFPVLNLELLG